MNTPLASNLPPRSSERKPEPSGPSNPSDPSDPSGPELEGAKTFLVRSWTGSFFPCLTGPAKNLQVSTVAQPESFTAMIVADLLLELPAFDQLAHEIVEMLEAELGEDDVFYFFKDHGRLPADADCTAVGLSVLLRAGVPLHETAHDALDRIRANVSREGVVETYFDPSGERSGLIDPVVATNVLYLAHLLGREQELLATESYVVEILASGRYREGTRYYPTPETFLYFLARVVAAFPTSRLTKRTYVLLREAIKERIGKTSGPIDLAQRVLAGKWVGVANEGEARTLVALQDHNGAWPADSLFQYGRTKIHFGSSGLSTAFAIAALHAAGLSDSIAIDSSLDTIRDQGFEQVSGIEFHFAVQD